MRFIARLPGEICGADKRPEDALRSAVRTQLSSTHS